MALQMSLSHFHWCELLWYLCWWWSRREGGGRSRRSPFIAGQYLGHRGPRGRGHLPRLFQKHLSESPASLPACLPACLVSRSICTSSYLVHQQARLWVKLSLASACVNGQCMYCVLELFAWTQLHLFHDRMHFESERVLIHKSCWDLAARTLWLVWHAKQQWVWTISQKWCGDRTNDNLLAPLTSFATHLTIAQMWRSASYLLAKYRTFTGRYLHFLGPY